MLGQGPLAGLVHKELIYYGWMSRGGETEI